MPLLGGIFKKKSRTNVGDSHRSSSLTSSRSDPDSTSMSSPTSEYVKTDTTIPSSPNGGSTLRPNAGTPSKIYPNIAASSSKLKLGFGRKKGSTAGSTAGSTYDDQDYFAPPRPIFTGRNSTSAASDSEASEIRRVGPPPSRSAMFAAHDGALSTRSLPNESIPQGLSPPALPSKKRPSLFPWSKSQPSTVSKASSKQPKSDDVLSPTGSNEDSFNLKSFRHVRPPSTELQYNSSTGSLVPPSIPGARPRNGSVGSESSQRIFVAAFREAQARRSNAGSPVPSFRSSSPHGIPTLPVSQNTFRDSPHTRSKPGTSPQNRHKRSSLALGYTSSDEDDSSEEESEDDEDGTGLSRRRTVTHRTNIGGPGVGGKNRGRATQSELGHGSLSTSSSHHFSGGNDGFGQSSRPQPDLNLYSGGVRPRASVSTSALTPNAAAKRASVLAAANSELGLDAHVRESSVPNMNMQDLKDAQNSDDSEDDAPLATLVAPRRPGSALSQNSSASQPSRPKPLIDINMLTGPNKRPLESGPKPQVAKSQAGFTGGKTLLSGVGSTSATNSPLASVTSTSPPIRFISPPSSPKALTRKDTDTLSVVTFQTTSSNGQSESGKKRDNLSERLRSVTQTRLGTTSSSGSISTNSRTSGAGDDIVIPRVSSPSPIKSVDSPVATVPSLSTPLYGGHGHRRASSDFTLKLNTFAPSSSSSGSGFPQSSGFGADNSGGTGEAEMSTMEDLASMLGGGIKLITKNGEEDPPESLTNSRPQPWPSDQAEVDGDAALPGMVAPIVIKERAPMPSFSVTSRPQHRQNAASISAGLVTSMTTTTTTTMTTSSSSSTSTSTSTTKAAISLSDPSAVSTIRQKNSAPSSTSSISAPTITQSKSASSLPSRVLANKPKAPLTETVVSSSSESSSSSSDSESESEPSKLPLSTVPSSTSKPSVSPFANAQRRPANANAASRPRSSTMSSLVSAPPSQNGPSWVNARSDPTKPFAISRESPASSTGDSSSGRVPITPRDGSEIGGSGSEFGSHRYSSVDSSGELQRSGRYESPAGKSEAQQKQWSGGASGLRLGKHIKRASVSFDESNNGKGKGKETPEEEEERRRERRRTEAKAAIELGNVINGRGPIDDDDDDVPISQTAAANGMGVMNPMMTGSMPMMPGFPPQPGAPAWGPWSQMPPNSQMSQFMIPPPSDPVFFAAHQQAMMIAKQAYQMAVAQQAMAAAGEEWERGSAVGFSSSQSMYGGPSGPSMMNGMGMGMGGANGWSTGSVIFPGGARTSVYGGGAQSEYGGPAGRGGGWNSSRSVYGESFGPSSSTDRLNRPGFGQRSSVFSQRDFGYFPPVPPVPQQHKNPLRQAANPRNRTVSQPASPARPQQKRAPPSSWKAV